MPAIIEIQELRKAGSRSFRRPHNASDGRTEAHGSPAPDGPGKTTTLRAQR